MINSLIVQKLKLAIAAGCISCCVGQADFKVPIKDGWFVYDGKIELAQNWKVVFILYPDGGMLKLDPGIEIDPEWVKGLRLDKSEERGPIELKKLLEEK